ncbi:unnamed protein product, partial [Lymnaea stagnalis]
ANRSAAIADRLSGVTMMNAGNESSAADAFCGYYGDNSTIISLMQYELARKLGTDFTFALNFTTWFRLLNGIDSGSLFLFYKKSCMNSTEDLLSVLESIMMRRQHNPVIEHHVGQLLYLYVSPILLILGTLGNLFSFIILRRKQMLKVSSYLYLATLAVVDTCVLYCGLLRLWVRELAEMDLQNSSDLACKVIVTFSYVTADISAWLITAVTVER